MHAFQKGLAGLLWRMLPALFLYTACQKTDHYYGQLSDTPEIYTSLGLDYSRLNNGVSRQYHVGDTLQINGRFNATSSQVTVQIGGVAATVTDLRKKDSITHQDQVTYYKTVETIRVVLTDAMGIGRLPVKVNCRGFALEGPLLYLLPKGNLPSVTDTLVWKQILNFKAYGNVTTNPALVDSFFANPVYYPSFSGTGNIFFGQKNRIQLLHPDGRTELVTDLQGSSDTLGPFSIVKMYNGAVDQQEHTLYFSAMTTDGYKTPGTRGTGIDADSNWIFRYCKLDLQSKRLQVVNRTIVPIYQKNVSALGTTAQMQALYAGEGPLSQVNLLPFSRTWADNQGNVYFTPIGLSFSIWDYDKTGRASYYKQIYDVAYASNGYNYLGKITPDGRVQYLMKARADWPGDGPNTPFAAARNTILSLDPVKGVMFSRTVISGNMEIVLYDLNSHATLAKLHPTTSGAGATGPFNLLDPITPAMSGAINYGGLGGENGRFLPLPGSANRFLYDIQNIVYDFTASQAYHYAPVILDSIAPLVPRLASYDPLGSNRSDLPEALLNFDQQGNLYKVAVFYTVYGSGYAQYYDLRRTYILKH